MAPAGRWTMKVSLPATVVVAPFLVFGLSTPVRDWALGALGYGLLPVFLWMASFLHVLRYRTRWIWSFWRLWAGSAILVAISLGTMAMFRPSAHVIDEASLGGNWGQYLGGTPVALGALKLAAILFLSPLVLYPRRAGKVYHRYALNILRWSATAVRWLRLRLRSARRTLSMVRPFGRRGDLMLRAPLSDPRFPTPPLGLPDDTIPSTSPTLPAPPSPVETSTQGEMPAHSGSGYSWRLPSLDLLSTTEHQTVPPEVLQQIARQIEGTLGEHKVEVAVEDIRTGPRVIRFGLVPGWMKQYRERRGGRFNDTSAGLEMSRVKVQSILVREKDLALALKTPHLRLEAPVPGEALVGLEVPNPYPRTVALRSIAESQAFQKIASKGGLPVALGEYTSGEPVVADLADLPHLLIAGATGSGKSVCINSIVASLLLTTPPGRLRMLMVDPKRVELTPFNGIPHLIAPVIMDTDEVLVVLRAILNEMLGRYKLLEENGVRNITGYNEKASERMSYLVIVIDELADLMMSAAYEAEQSLVRLAQLGRATGIHVILATQRPSVNVVTGLLKANIPARIAFAVASQVDSRVILDSVGAEKLLGKGDMLMLTSDSPKPMRVQGTFVHDREIEKLVAFWKGQVGPPLPHIPLHEHREVPSHDTDLHTDDLLDSARELAERYPHISPSVLQRRLQIGYAKAKELIEMLEDEGIIPRTS